MLDPKLLRNNLESVTQALLRRGFALDIDEYQSLEADRRSLQAETENLQNERNVKSKLIPAKLGLIEWVDYFITV